MNKGGYSMSKGWIGKWCGGKAVMNDRVDQQEGEISG